MYNRHVDGLATWAPTDTQIYRESGARLALRAAKRDATASEHQSRSDSDGLPTSHQRSPSYLRRAAAVAKMATTPES
jgi:hypothetical protein